jgi:hypothetical protein
MTTMYSTIRQPSAFLPVAISLVALALVLGHIVLFGGVHEADEGAIAHIWQLLMAVQVPIIASKPFNVVSNTVSPFSTPAPLFSPQKVISSFYLRLLKNNPALL